MRNKILPLLLLVGALAACEHPEYDLSKGVDLTVRLFEDEITVPIGSTAPITVKATLGKTSLYEFVKEGDDGLLWAEEESETYAVDIYEILASKPAEVTNAPFTWETGYHYASPASMVSMLAFLGFTSPNQTVTLKAYNPLTKPIGLTGNASVIARNMKTYQQTWAQTQELNETLESNSNVKTFYTFNVPVDDAVSAITVDKLTLSLPAEPASYLRSKSQPRFILSVQHRANVAVPPTFSMKQALPLTNLNVPLGNFKLRKCVAELTLVNTLPLDVTIHSIQVLQSDGTTVDDNIVISNDIEIGGGSLDAPTESTVRLQVEALTGTIPDITGINIDVTVKGSDTHQKTVLSAKQGLSVKSASAKIVGGITLGSHE